MLPPGVVSLLDHEAHARTRLDPNALAYLDSVAGDGLTQAANRQAWDSLRLVPRILRPHPAPQTAVTLLGRRLAHPLLLAPLAFQRLFHPDGEVAAVLAAAAQQAGYVLSTLSSVSLEQVADTARADSGRGPLWFQLYFQHDRAATLELVRRAEQAGFEAIVLTVDAPVSGVRDGERRARFRLPAGIRAANLAADSPRAGDASVGELLAAAPGWPELDWLVQSTRLPVLLKGVLHPADARAAVAGGVQGLIVSNHGGRTLDGAVATAEALPRIRDAVGDTLPVLVDGAIRRGGDVLKAMTLGASAVLLGRPVAWGLASAGALGVAHSLRVLRDELEASMALCGVSDLAQLPADLLVASASGSAARAS